MAPVPYPVLYSDAKTSDTRTWRSRGVTLVELLVVLALLGLIGALVLPNVENFYSSVARNTERERILDQIAGLGAEAMLRGRGFVVLGTVEADPLTVEADPTADPPAVATRVHDPTGLPVYPLEIPAGWEAHLDAPLVVRATGACLGARLTLTHEDAPPVHVELVAPYCRVDDTATELAT